MVNTEISVIASGAKQSQYTTAFLRLRLPRSARNDVWMGCELKLAPLEHIPGIYRRWIYA